MYTKALYYPTIDINDENWLKTAALYWDNIYTIVPESIESPYYNKTSNFLYECKLLKPYTVREASREVREIAPDVISFLSSDEASRILFNKDSKQLPLHADKLSYRIKDLFSSNPMCSSRMHLDKFSPMLMEELKDIFGDSSSGWVNVNKGFGQYYMSVLANRISMSKGYAMISDNPMYDNFASRYVSGVSPTIESVADGILGQIVIKKVGVRNDVTIEDVMKFKSNNMAQIVKFRGAMQGLCECLFSGDAIDSVDALRERLNSIYTNSVEPSILDLKENLKISFSDVVLKDFSISGVAGAVATFAEIPAWGLYALLAGAGVSVSVGGFLYHNKRKQLNQNPYSYVLSIDKDLGYKKY